MDSGSFDLSPSQTLYSFPFSFRRLQKTPCSLSLAPSTLQLFVYIHTYATTHLSVSSNHTNIQSIYVQYIDITYLKKLYVPNIRYIKTCKLTCKESRASLKIEILINYKKINDNIHLSYGGNHAPSEQFFLYINIKRAFIYLEANPNL